jgi:hypothetical protein
MVQRTDDIRMRIQNLYLKIFKIARHDDTHLKFQNQGSRRISRLKPGLGYIGRCYFNNKKYLK